MAAAARTKGRTAYHGNVWNHTVLHAGLAECVTRERTKEEGNTVEAAVLMCCVLGRRNTCCERRGSGTAQLGRAAVDPQSFIAPARVCVLHGACSLQAVVTRSAAPPHAQRRRFPAAAGARLSATASGALSASKRPPHGTQGRSTRRPPSPASDAASAAGTRLSFTHKATSVA